MYLDGEQPSEARVIAALRERGGAGNLYQIASDVGITLRSVQRNIAKLKRQGRVYQIGTARGPSDRALWGLRDGMAG